MTIRVLKGMFVRKITGYPYYGRVVSRFFTGDRKERFVVEMWKYDKPTGMLHIFNREQLEYVKRDAHA
jgi:hypothetical protein